MERKNSFIAALLAAVMLAVTVILIAEAGEYRREITELPDSVDVQLLEIDGEARNGKKMERVNAVVIHYTGNPGKTAQQIRASYSENGCKTAPHFIIGLKGEIIQCIPLNEKSSVSNEKNRDSISIEVCHPDESGRFTHESYVSLVKLTAWLCETCGLAENNVLRHYDVTGVECPLYFVMHEDAWNEFKEAVRERMK